VRNQKGDKEVLNSLGAPPLPETAHVSMFWQWWCVVPRAAKNT